MSGMLQTVCITKFIFEIFNFVNLGATCKNTWDGETAGYECEKPKMFVLQSGGEQGQFAPYKLHRYGLQEANGKAERFGYQYYISSNPSDSEFGVHNHRFL